jgi:ferredoxin
VKHLYRAWVRAGLALVVPLDRLFNRLHTSAYNPLYRSGTLAVVSLVMALLSGLYLIFFYSLSDPHASMQRLHNAVWLGPWVRSFHRYASALTLAATLVHALRMFLQGKSWGGRVLAWISGVVLLGMILVSGWTGYVLVWDRQAQTLALAFAGMMDALGLFPEPMAYSFNGRVARPLPSFFFLMLFLHVVVPLALAFGLWVHTSRLARAAWSPRRPMTMAIVLLTALTASRWPVLLEPAADLLQFAGGHSVDLLYTGWLDAARQHPRLVVAGATAIFATLLLLPFTIRPAKKELPAPSFNDPAICIGCRQCAEDCPYEAIHMVARPHDPLKRLSTLLAVVHDDRCVSCGACAASCPVHTMGPAGRKGPDQLAALEAFLAALPDRGVPRSRMTVLLACNHQPGSQARYAAWAEQHPDVCVYSVNCGGTVHPNVLEKLAAHFDRVVIAACPPRNCVTKDGFLLLSERVNGQRMPPRFSDPTAQKRIHILPTGDGEERQVYDFIATSQQRSASRLGVLCSVVAGVAWVALIAAATRFTPAAASPEHGILRLNWRLTGQRERSAIARTPDELAALPAHMRTPFVMQDEPVPYQLSAQLNGKPLLDRTVESGGFRNDGPLYVLEDVELPPGSHALLLRFAPANPRHTNAVALTFRDTVDVQPGRITLIHYQPEDRSLVVKQGVAAQ